MTRYLLAAVLLLVMVQEAPEPPPGWFCSPNGQADHKCACKRMGDPADSCETVTEEAVCKVYCHPKSCRCPIVCEMHKG